MLSDNMSGLLKCNLCFSINDFHLTLKYALMENLVFLIQGGSVTPRYASVSLDLKIYYFMIFFFPSPQG